MNKYTFKEVCKRVLNGNQVIRREGWKQNCHLIFEKATFRVNANGIKSELNAVDIDAKDWVDPGE